MRGCEGQRDDAAEDERAHHAHEQAASPSSEPPLGSPPLRERSQGYHALTSATYDASPAGTSLLPAKTWPVELPGCSQPALRACATSAPSSSSSEMSAQSPSLRASRNSCVLSGSPEMSATSEPSASRTWPMSRLAYPSSSAAESPEWPAPSRRVETAMSTERTAAPAMRA